MTCYALLIGPHWKSFTFLLGADLRGYGPGSVPADATVYTPLQKSAGDLVGLLNALKIASAVFVGHDWGATRAWNAAMMRPD
jgi:pimeloyl-ACP methyl ester carboxylesterase